MSIYQLEKLICIVNIVGIRTLLIDWDLKVFLYEGLDGGSGIHYSLKI